MLGDLPFLAVQPPVTDVPELTAPGLGLTLANEAQFPAAAPSGPAITSTIASEEDPQRPVEEPVVDEVMGDDGVGDGIGVEDEAEGDGSPDDDDDSSLPTSEFRVR